MDVATEQDRERRKRDLARLDEDQKEAEKAKRRQNKDFVQVYAKGFKRIRWLLKENPRAAELYLFLAEHIDQSAGTVVASQQLLADELKVSRRTIIRLVSWMEENSVFTKIDIGGGSLCGYCLNPDEVWRSFDGAKEYAAFRTKTLARKSDNGDIKRRLKVMMKVNGQTAGLEDTDDATESTDDQ